MGTHNNGALIQNAFAPAEGRLIALEPEHREGKEIQFAGLRFCSVFPFTQHCLASSMVGRAAEKEDACLPFPPSSQPLLSPFF